MHSTSPETNGHVNGVINKPLNWTEFYNTSDCKFMTTPKTRHSINPATAKPNQEVPPSTQGDVGKTVVADKRACKLWAATPYAEHQKCSTRLCQRSRGRGRAFLIDIDSGTGQAGIVISS